MSGKTILIVGAGSVGQVYAYQLANAGHQVAFLIKEKYLDSLKDGYVLYDLARDKQKRSPIQVTDIPMYTSWEHAQEQTWDHIILAFTSTALHQLDLSVLKKTLGNGTLALMQPGPEDYYYLTAAIPSQQIVFGWIMLLGYESPLRTENVHPTGTAYWIAPFTRTPFDGPESRTQDIIDLFNQAKMPAGKSNLLSHKSVFSVAYFMIFLTALEAAGWSLKELRHDRSLLRQIKQAKRETFAALEHKYDLRAPLSLRILPTWLLKLATVIAPKLIPFDAEAYLQVHFMKVKEQTKLFMQSYIRFGRDTGVNISELQSLDQLT